MRLSEIFTERYIRLGLAGRTKHDLFIELVNSLAKWENINTDEVLRTLWIREKMLNTRIAPGIAIQHTQIPGLPRTIGILAIEKTGVPYDLPGGVKVQLVMFLLDDVNATTEHLETLRNFALLARNPRFLEQLLACTDAAGVLRTIKEYEARL